MWLRWVLNVDSMEKAKVFQRNFSVLCRSAGKFEETTRSARKVGKENSQTHMQSRMETRTWLRLTVDGAGEIESLLNAIKVLCVFVKCLFMMAALKMRQSERIEWNLILVSRSIEHISTWFMAKWMLNWQFNVGKRLMTFSFHCFVTSSFKISTIAHTAKLQVSNAFVLLVHIQIKFPTLSAELMSVALLSIRFSEQGGYW